jgi:uncharacterized protein with PQ loop repeat
MDVDSTLLFVATSIGVYQFMNEIKDVYNMKNIDEYDMQYVISGIIASMMWSIYQYRGGSNYYAMYSLLGAFLGLYTLVQIRRKSAKDAAW